MLGACLRAELGIVQQQVGELTALLNEVQLGHPVRLALELAGRDAEYLGKNIPRVVETQRLIEITGEDVALPGLYFFLHKLEFGWIVSLAHTATQPSSLLRQSLHD